MKRVAWLWVLAVCGACFAQSDPDLRREATQTRAWGAGEKSALVEYVRKPDAAYGYEVVRETAIGGHAVVLVKMTSQRWQGTKWWHWVAVVMPEDVKPETKATLIIAGGSNRNHQPPRLDGGQGRFMVAIAAATGAPVALVAQVPNQPALGNKYEDHLIAETFDRYLKERGDDWPLLGPMTKSAVRAMDTVESIVEERRDAKVTGFVVTGASKRGWTTWLTAASDGRVKAIAPMVIDTLNMDAQMTHQYRSIGGYREAIEPYTELKIPQRMHTPRGRALTRLVDPYAYREKLTLPKYVVLGTNDPYWTTDASGVYFDGLKGPKWLYYAPNRGHGLGPEAYFATQAFAAAVVQGKALPNLTWQHDAARGELVVTCSAPKAKATVWRARSGSRDFLKSRWTGKTLDGAGPWRVKLESPDEGFAAAFVSVSVDVGLWMPLPMCSEVVITPNRFEHEPPRR